jgi:hypothetical protein
MQEKNRPETEDDEERNLENKAFSVTPEARVAFDILKAEQGPRSGPRLIAEAIDLLLVHYGKKPVGRPVRSPTRREPDKPAPG